MRINVIVPKKMLTDLEQFKDLFITRNKIIRKAVHEYIIKKGEEIYGKQNARSRNSRKPKYRNQ